MEKRNPLRVFAAVCLIVTGVLLAVGIIVFGLDNETATKRDFLEYWSAEQQLAHGGNPYDAKAILQSEKSVGFDKDTPLISLSPPVALFWALPLGWVSAKTGLTLWLLLLFACLLVAIWVLWLLLGKPESRYHLIGIFFPPAMWCLTAGQLGIFFLLETVLFLYWQKTRPFLAGAALMLWALKPHLFLPFMLALLLWSLYKREYRVLAGLAAATAVSCLLTLSMDGQVWQQYAEMMRSNHVLENIPPTVSVAVMFLVDRNAKWIEFLGEAGGCIWAIWYFWRRRERWDWMSEGLVVLLASIACTPYSWYTDQAVVFPAVVAALGASKRPGWALALFAAIAGAGLISFMADIPLTSGFYVWTAPAWLLWYLFAKRDREAAA